MCMLSPFCSEYVVINENGWHSTHQTHSYPLAQNKVRQVGNTESFCFCGILIIYWGNWGWKWEERRGREMNSKIGKTKIWQISRDRQKIMWKANWFLIIYVDLEKGRITQSKKETKSNEPYIFKVGFFFFFANLCPPESICNMLKDKQIQVAEVKKGRENRYKKEKKGLPSSPWGWVLSKFHSAQPTAQDLISIFSVCSLQHYIYSLSQKQ